jgi:hypothetical protein
VEAGLDKGRAPPQWFLDKPEILDGDEFYFSAFWELSSTRALGFSGVGPLPWNHVRDYAVQKGMDDGMISMFQELLRAMDNAYLEWNREQQDTKMKSSREPPKKP